jgi:hypothetical protein
MVMYICICVLHIVVSTLPLFQQYGSNLFVVMGHITPSLTKLMIIISCSNLSFAHKKCGILYSLQRRSLYCIKRRSVHPMRLMGNFPHLNRKCQKRKQNKIKFKPQCHLWQYIIILIQFEVFNWSRVFDIITYLRHGGYTLYWTNGHEKTTHDHGIYFKKWRLIGFPK